MFNERLKFLCLMSTMFNERLESAENYLNTITRGYASRGRNEHLRDGRGKLPSTLIFFLIDFFKSGLEYD